MQKVHFIAIGGAVMHNLAIALKEKGIHVTGSDDVIFDPARSKLKQYDLLPSAEGWFPEKITTDLDAVILGMHAHADNPELQRALDLNIPVISFPELIYNLSRHKQRIVVAGSHGKTTISGMIVYALLQNGYDVDYVIGASVDQLEHNVRITDDAPIIVIEGDEYLTSSIDRKPKFLHYKPHIAVLTSICWDHINVFPEFHMYVEQFQKYVDSIIPNGICIYCNDEPQVIEVVKKSQNNIEKIPYGYPEWKTEKGRTFLITAYGDIEIRIFGRHNMQNIEAARQVCKALGLDDQSFYRAISHFGGAKNRLTLLYDSQDVKIFRDFAHAPDKVKATVEAVAEQFPDYHIVACLELHTYSSLSKKFLPFYRDTLSKAHQRVVYYDPKVLKLKRLPEITNEDVRHAFADEQLLIQNDMRELIDWLKSYKRPDRIIFLFMSSGNFQNLNFTEIL